MTKHLQQIITQELGEFYGINEIGEIIIVPTTYVHPNEYNNGFYIRGLTGARYGVIELNNISKIYGYGYGASTETEARSITIEDVNKMTGYNPLNTGVYDPDQTGIGIPCFAGNLFEYGNKVTFSWDETEYPYYLCSNEVKGNLLYSHKDYGFNWLDNSLIGHTSTYTTDTSKIVTLVNSYQRYYGTTLTDSDSDTVINDSNSQRYKTIFIDYLYWTASPMEWCWLNSAEWGLVDVTEGGTVNRIGLYYSTGETKYFGAGVRPVVSLKSDISLEKTSNNNWNIR